MHVGANLSHLPRLQKKNAAKKEKRMFGTGWGRWEDESLWAVEGRSFIGSVIGRAVIYGEAE